MEAINSDEIIEQLRKQIEGIEREIDIQEVGSVITVGDGIARIHGLEKVMYGELLELPHGVIGLALNLEEDQVGSVLLGKSTKILEGDTVKRTGRIMEVPVGDALVGRVVNPLGQPLDGKGPVETTKFNPVERIAPGVVRPGHRHHHQSERDRRHLHLRRHRPETVHGRPGGEAPRGVRRHEPQHRSRGGGLGSRAAAVPGAVRRMRHG
jgi:hypothetical protein